MDQNKIERIFLKLIEFKDELFDDNSLRDCFGSINVDDEVLEKMEEDGYFTKNTSIDDIASFNIVVENEEGIWFDSSPTYFLFSLYIDRTYNIQSSVNLSLLGDGNFIKGDEVLVESISRNLWYMLEYSDAVDYMNEKKEKAKLNIEKINKNIEEYLGKDMIEVKTDFERISMLHFVDEVDGIKKKLKIFEKEMKKNNQEYKLELTDREELLLERLFSSRIYVEMNKNLNFDEDTKNDIMDDVMDMIILGVQRDIQENVDQFKYLREIKLNHELNKIEREKTTRIRKKV